MIRWILLALTAPAWLTVPAEAKPGGGEADGKAAKFSSRPRASTHPAPDVPRKIAVPPGHKLLCKFEAQGVQIYKAVAGKDDRLIWVLEAPLANLLDAKNPKAGWHYEGPSWEAADGSKVVRDQTAKVKSAPAPKPEKDIPWLLVKVKAAKGKGGKLSPVVYIQRLRTAGGKAPAELPKRLGTKVGVAYKAVYYFYSCEPTVHRRP
jgi:hypothetical protein